MKTKKEQKIIIPDADYVSPKTHNGCVVLLLKKLMGPEAKLYQKVKSEILKNFRLIRLENT